MENKKVFSRGIVSRQEVGTTASVMQRNDLVFHTFVSDFPAVILLRRGRKTLTVGPKKTVLNPGDAVAIAAGTKCDLLNETDRGQFESTWIVCAGNLIEDVSVSFPALKTLTGALSLKGHGDHFLQSFERAVKAISTSQTVPTLIAGNHVRELLLWLAHAGYVFQAEGNSNLARKLRLMISASPAQEWISTAVANSLAMSEATFRRKLREQGSTFNDILTDVRMTAALTLLQVTDRPIAEIALDVGYESASRFSIRFKKRFGFSPAAVRGQQKS